MPIALRELGERVRHEVHALRLLGPLPRLHHERIVHGQADDVVDAGVLEVLETRDVAGHVSRAARGRERAGQREQDHATTAEQLAGADAPRLAVLISASSTWGTR